MQQKKAQRPTLVFVPGLRDHVEDHWQTILARKCRGSVTVPPLEADKLSRAARVAALQATLGRIDGPVVLVAHSAGVMITVHWAQLASRPIHGALLAAPAIWKTRCRPAIRNRRRSPKAAGCRFRAPGCRSRALSPPAATIRWPASTEPSKWPATGAVAW